MYNVFVCIALGVLLAYAVSMTRMLKDMLAIQTLQAKIIRLFFERVEVEKEEK